MKQEPPRSAQPKKRADHYDDPEHNALHYWYGRAYEHAAEEAALQRLLAGKHFATAVDVGGGFGRLCKLLLQHVDKLTLVDPSQQQLALAQTYLVDYPDVHHLLAQADELPFKDASIDLVTLIRVLPHLPSPNAEFAEIARILSPDGMAIIEVANYTHARNRLKLALRIKRMPQQPVDIRSAAKRLDSNEVSFVNHHPETIIKQLAQAGLKVDQTLSVSNFRSKALKKTIPQRWLLKLERFSQPFLARYYFGPSIFFLVKKASS